MVRQVKCDRKECINCKNNMCVSETLEFKTKTTHYNINPRYNEKKMVCLNYTRK